MKRTRPFLVGLGLIEPTAEDGNRRSTKRRRLAGAADGNNLSDEGEYSRGSSPERSIVSTTRGGGGRSPLPPPPPPNRQIDHMIDNDVQQGPLTVPLERAAKTVHQSKMQVLDEMLQETAIEIEVADVVAALPDRPIQRHFRSLCYLCEWGNTHVDRPDSGCTGFSRLCDMIVKHYSAMSNISLGTLMAEYYMNNIYVPARERDHATPLPAMRPMDMVEHFTTHIIDGRIILGELIRSTRNMIDILENQVAYATGQIDHRAALTLIKCKELLFKLIRIKPDERLAFSGNPNQPIELDPMAVGNVANLRGIEPLLQRNVGNLIGGATASRTGDVDPRTLHRFERPDEPAPPNEASSDAAVAPSPDVEDEESVW